MSKKEIEEELEDIEEDEEIDEDYDEKPQRKSHKFLNFLIIVVLFGILCVFYAKYVGTKGLIVKEYRVESNILTENFSGLKIVHFSDLLYKSTVDKNDIKKLINRINELRPDIIVFTGDLVNKNAKISDADVEFLKTELSKLKTSIGKYAIYGDYDYSFNEYESVMNSSDFKILNNSYEEIFYNTEDPIYIVGLPSSIKESINLYESFNFYKDENRKFIIVLVHDGTSIKALDDSTYEVDMILGGHSLGGSVRLPFYGGLFIDENSYKYYDSEYKKGITNIFISSGLGTNKVGYRFLNKPSFNFYRLKAQS